MDKNNKGVEALARVLRVAAGDDEHRMILNMSNTRSGRQARNLLANPGPLLAALAEAGVLTEVYSLARHDPSPDMSGKKVQHAGESPDRSVMERVAGLPHSEGRWIERRYVSEWEAQP